MIANSVLPLYYIKVSIFIPFLMSTDQVYILAIESSCDDTSAAVIHNGKMLSNVVANQKIHEAYGGVVPELAFQSTPSKI